jgi:hypothetical protein
VHFPAEADALCHSVPVDGLLGAIIGLAVAAVLAIINSWLSDRQKVAEGVRDERIRTYPAVWERTSVVSRWPRTDATREHATHLHLDLRTWYYSGGGLFLSEDTQDRYEHLQVVLEAVIARNPSEPLQYDSLMDAAHWFRAGLAEDLRTREHHNLVSAWRWRKRRERELDLAETRENDVGARELVADGVSVRREPTRTPMVMLTQEEDQLRGSEPPNTTPYVAS